MLSITDSSRASTPTQGPSTTHLPTFTRRLKIYDSAGDAVTGAEDNDSGSGLNARYVFEPTSAGDYYIEVSAHGGNSVGTFGTYTVEVRVVT